MDTLFAVIITGMAVAYFVELVTTLGEGIFSSRVVRLVLTLPLSIIGCWFLDLTAFTLAVSSCAAAFFALALLRVINRPVTIQNLNRR